MPGFGKAFSVARFVAALAAVVFAAATFAQPQNVLPHVARENAGLAAQVAAAAVALDLGAAELAELQKARRDLDRRMHWVERRAGVHALGNEFAQTLIDFLRRLPKPERFVVASDRRTELMAAASDAELRVERALRELEDLDAAAAKRVASAQPPVPEEARAQVEPAIRSALGEQRDLLLQLVALQRKRLEALRHAEDADRDLQRQGEVARAELTRYLFWIPAPPSTRTVGEFPLALAWTVSPANWHAAGAVLREHLAQRPFWPAVALLAAVGLLALRGRLRRALLSLAPAAVTLERYRIGHVLAALAITVALALPVPIVLRVAGTLLAAAPDGQPFVLALGGALVGTSRLLLAIAILAWLVDRNGVAIRHFGWDEEALAGVARALRRLAAIIVPLILLAVLNGQENAPFANRESLGRLAFSLAMLTLAVFLARLLRRGAPLMQRLRAHAPRGWAVQLHVAWFGALVAIPLVVAGLSAAGYFVAAGYVWTRIVYSALLALGAVMLYGLMALWVQVQRQNLARRGDRDAARAGQGDAAPEDVGQVAGARPMRVDIAAIGEQTRSLLDLLVTVVLLAGLWWVWRDAVVTLTAIGDYTLWTYTETVDGKAVTHALTVGRLILALVVGVVTVVVVRNLGALLDIALLQRFEMKTDATYAIKVIARYAVATAGLLAASDIVGIGWSDVQWLVAALSVGLGFGLQEIVANFVSGLIVLAERPIRIGDVVTVGNVSGTVARIRARATVVVDFDYKEVIIPNKAFITEHVINWTLSNQTTRLLVKVGVAYGSDIERVRRVLLDAVLGIGDVLREPPPSVFFTAFGDSTLDFEVRAYVDALDKRLPVQHAINLAIARTLRESGIEIPFPQRDLHIRSARGPAGAPRDGTRS